MPPPTIAIRGVMPSPLLRLMQRMANPMQWVRRMAVNELLPEPILSHAPAAESSGDLAVMLTGGGARGVPGRSASRHRAAFSESPFSGHHRRLRRRDQRQLSRRE